MGVRRGGEDTTVGAVTVTAKSNAVAAVQPQPGDRICDPACGSGSLLIKCARAVGSNDYALYGQEVNGSTWALAKMNMFLHDVSQADIQ